MRVSMLILTTLLGLAGSVTDAAAGVITTAGAVLTPGNVSTGSLGPLGVTGAPNNDEAAGPNVNAIAYQFFFNAKGALEVEFVVAASGGVTEYAFGQNFINNSREAWTGLRFELGFGTGAQFVRSGATDGLDFDAPTSMPTSSRFAVTRRGTDVLEFGQAVAPWISATQFAFAVDVPDGLATVNPYGLSRFTLRQVANPGPEPSVPETSATTLAALGLVWAGRRLRRA